MTHQAAFTEVHYGAFELQRLYHRHLAIGFYSSITFLLLIMTTSILLNLLTSHQESTNIVKTTIFPQPPTTVIDLKNYGSGHPLPQGLHSRMFTRACPPRRVTLPGSPVVFAARCNRAIDLVADIAGLEFRTDVRSSSSGRIVRGSSRAWPTTIRGFA